MQMVDNGVSVRVCMLYVQHTTPDAVRVERSHASAYQMLLQWTWTKSNSHGCHFSGAWVHVQPPMVGASHTQFSTIQTHCIGTYIHTSIDRMQMHQMTSTFTQSYNRRRQNKRSMCACKHDVIWERRCMHVAQIQSVSMKIAKWQIENFHTPNMRIQSTYTFRSRQCTYYVIYPPLWWW